MQKKASDSGSGQSALHTVKFALSWLFKQIKEYVSQSPVPAGLIKVPLFIKLLLYIFSKFGRLVLWEIIFIFELQFAETQVGKYIDNGPMEGFWGILKRERYYGRRFTDKETLVKMIEDYIDYYNNKRLQRGLGVLTPMEKHEIYLQAA